MRDRATIIGTERSAVEGAYDTLRAAADGVRVDLAPPCRGLRTMSRERSVDLRGETLAGARANEMLVRT